MARILGLDIGIGSCGWAVVDLPEVDAATGEVTREFAIVACGSRCFDLPENPKNRELMNKNRRLARGQRRVVRRRRQRLHDIRKLLSEQGLPAWPVAPAPLQEDDPGRERQAHLAWHLRAEALERVLEGGELAHVLLHIAKHRGYRSNSKRDRANQSEGRRLGKAIEPTQQRLAQYRSFGEMMARDQAFASRKRNRPNDYKLTPLRTNSQEEIRKIFTAQRKLDSTIAGEDLEQAYKKIAFRQRPLESKENDVGVCLFEVTQKRAPRNCPSFELFRFLQKLNNTRFRSPGSRSRLLCQQERDRALALFPGEIESADRITFADVRRAIGLPAEATFAELAPRGVGAKGRRGGVDEPENREFARFEGSARLVAALGGKEFARLVAEAPAALDAAMALIVFQQSDEFIRENLPEVGLPEALVGRLSDELASFDGLNGVGHISAKACRSLMPHLRQGLDYRAACIAAGYDPDSVGTMPLDRIGTATVRRGLRECLAQIKAVRCHVEALDGVPIDAVHLEMAREVGKSAKVRNDIASHQESRRKEKKKRSTDFKDCLGLGREPTDTELERYELWLEQKGRSLYSEMPEEGYICPDWLLDGDTRVQVDHIYPYSRCGDDGYRNKVLCLTSENQRKGRWTPWEWFAADGRDWDAFTARVVTSLNDPRSKEKRRKLLRKEFAEIEKGYRARHLQETQYLIRVLRRELEKEWPELRTRPGDRRRLFARPGPVTSMARRAWGLDDLKRSGKLGDRDHALDAIVIACLSERHLVWLVKWHQWREQAGLPFRSPELPVPIAGKPRLSAVFRSQRPDHAEQVQRELLRTIVETAVRGRWFVSRSETRRGRGPAHDATLYGWRSSDQEEVQYQRLQVRDLKPIDLARLKGDPKRNTTLRQTLEAWLSREARQREDAAARARGEGLPKPAEAIEDLPRMPSSKQELHELPARQWSGPAVRHVLVARAKWDRRNESWKSIAPAGVKLHRGNGRPAHADNAGLARVDVFRVGEQFQCVPIYAWQIADRTRFPRPPTPSQTTRRKRGKGDAPKAEFYFSLYPGSFISAVTASGELHEGYYRTFDGQSGELKYQPPDTGDSKFRCRFKTKTLSSLRMFHIDRLGNRFPIAPEEPRLWHGEVCS